jgi:proteic killer suppression protein
MILSLTDFWLRNFFVGDARSKKIPADMESRLFRKIQMIDDATTDQDLRVPPSHHFEKLRGNLDGFHSIRVNQQRRLIFRWARVFGNSADFWLNVQRRSDLWETMNSPEERERIARARSLKAAA